MSGRPRFRFATSLLLSTGVWLLAAISALPTRADFNEVLQIICDEDLPIAGDCDATADGLRFVNTVAVSSDDQHVYICSSLADDAGSEPLQNESLSALSRGIDGTLTLVDQEIEGSGGVSTLESCRGVAVSPDGGHVYTAALVASAVTWFSRTAMTGALTFTAGDSVSDGEQGSELSGATAVAVSPDDAHVYVVGRTGDSVAAFSRNTTTGDLTLLANYIDGIALVDGLDGAEEIAISPDGKHVYIASIEDNAVAVFARDDDSGSGTFGELTFVEAQFDGVGGVNGLENAVSVALDMDGENVYVASERGVTDGDWLAVFSRNPATGALTFLQAVQSSQLEVSINCSGVGPSDSSVAVSPNGVFVAVSEPFKGAIATFSRSDTGIVSLVESICDDLFVLEDGIGSVVDLAISGDGLNLYAAGGANESLATIDYECSTMDIDLELMSENVSTAKTEDACRSIAVGSGYNILAAGSVIMESPFISVSNEVSVAGELTVLTSVP